MRPVVGVLGGSGGVGASSFAAILAALAGSALLIDLDVTGGGVDVLLGIENEPGARWSGMRLAGGRLDPQLLRAGLPRWGPCAVLAADAPALDPAAVVQVLDAATESDADVVVLDLPRAGNPERAAALSRCDLVVVLARCNVPGLVAAHAAVSALPELPVGVVLRRGPVPADDAAALVGAPLVGCLPPLGAAWEPDPARLPRSARRVASGVLDGLRLPAAASSLPASLPAPLPASSVAVTAR